MGHRFIFGWQSLHIRCPFRHWYIGPDWGKSRHTGHSKVVFKSSIETQGEGSWVLLSIAWSDVPPLASFERLRRKHNLFYFLNIVIVAYFGFYKLICKVVKFDSWLVLPKYFKIVCCHVFRKANIVLVIITLIVTLIHTPLLDAHYWELLLMFWKIFHTLKL